MIKCFISQQNLHSLFCWVLYICFKTIKSNRILCCDWNDLKSLLNFPFQIFNLKYPYSCFSFHFCLVYNGFCLLLPLLWLISGISLCSFKYIFLESEYWWICVNLSAGESTFSFFLKCISTHYYPSCVRNYA